MRNSITWFQGRNVNWTGYDWFPNCSTRRLFDFALCALALGSGPIEKWSIFWRQTNNIRVRMRLARHFPSKIYSLRTLYGTLHFRDNFGDITNLVDIFYRQVYRPRIMPVAGPIVDIGANIGLAAAWFSHYIPKSTIYCFEPVEANTALIKLNCPGAKVEKIAIGRGTGRVTLHLDSGHVMASLINCPWTTQECEFNVMALDEIATLSVLDWISVLKIDVEGMEVAVLEGGLKTLRKTRQVLMETHSHTLHADAARLLRHMGFTIDADDFSGSTGMVYASRQA